MPTLIHRQINAQVYAFVNDYYMQFGCYPSQMVVCGDIINAAETLAWLTPHQKNLIQANYLRDQLASLCNLWVSTCASYGWNPACKIEYPNALNVLSDRYAMTPHLRQQVEKMSALWNSISLALGSSVSQPPQHADAYPALSA